MDKTTSDPINKILFSYYRGLLSENEIIEIKTELNKIDFELILHDQSGIIYNSLEDFTNMIFVAIHSSIILNIISGVAENAVWDTIKLVLIKIWNKVKDKKVTRLSAGNNKKEIGVTFGVKAKLDKNTEYDFRLDGDLTEKTTLLAIDKIIDFLKEQSINTKYQPSNYVKFCPETKEWEKVDVLKEIRKKVDEK